MSWGLTSFGDCGRALARFLGGYDLDRGVDDSGVFNFPKSPNGVLKTTVSLCVNLVRDERLKDRSRTLPDHRISLLP